MADAGQASATKDDIRLLMEEIGKLYIANEQWKNEILDANEKWKDEILDASEQWKEEIKRHFDVVAENMRHDLLGVNKDRIENHEDRLKRIETHLSLAA